MNPEGVKGAAPRDVDSYGEFRYAAWSPRFMAACSVICLAIALYLLRFLAPVARGAIPEGASLTEVVLVAAYCLVLLGASLYMAFKSASRLRFFLKLGRDGFAVPGRVVSWSALRTAQFQMVQIRGRGQERLKATYLDPKTGRESTLAMDWVLTGWDEVKDIFQRHARSA